MRFLFTFRKEKPCQLFTQVFSALCNVAMEAGLLVGLLAVATWQLAIGQNLLRNPSFESELFEEDWINSGFTMERTVEDSKHGSYSLKCTER